MHFDVSCGGGAKQDWAAVWILQGDVAEGNNPSGEGAMWAGHKRELSAATVKEPGQLEN